MAFGGRDDQFEAAGRARTRIDDRHRVGAILPPVRGRKGNHHKTLDGAGRPSPPHVSDIPATTMGPQDFLDQEDANVDRKISGICRGC